MKIVDTFPHAVREIENVWIPMRDGVRLAARLWLPGEATATNPMRPRVHDSAAAEESAPRAPAILEWIPYRKRDATRDRDETMHRWFAGHGYAAVRIDVRGSGDSEGLLLDEYLPLEQEDALEAIAWIAAQPWCSGRVGLIGKSWGGIAALQIAARRPPALGAVITVCSTDDRYLCDAHYMGGRLLLENLAWGSMLMASAAQPPDPAIVGDAWREMWQRRLDAVQPFPEIWMRHPARDAYWRQGSVSEDYSRIECPVYAVGGWADAYADTVPRLLSGLCTPRKGLVGPWAHVYPHEGVPGPAIGFLQEAKRWWDQWLRGVETGIMEEPMYRAWMQGVGGGRWVAEDLWPSSRIVTRRMTFAPTGLRLDADPELATANEAGLANRTPQTVGRASGSWCLFGSEPEFYPDQANDDVRSLVFDSAPLEKSFEILGAPEVRLKLAVDQPEAFVVVRLCDVAPDGRSTRVSYGVLDLARRDGSDKSVSVIPGVHYDIRVGLRHAAHAFEAGHRIRVAISTSYWPIVWPTSEPVTVTVYPGSSELELPERPSQPNDEDLRAFEPAEGARTGVIEDIDPSGMRSEVERDPVSGRTLERAWIDVCEGGEPAMLRLEDADLEIGHGIEESFEIRDEDPTSARARIEHRVVRRRTGWEARVVLRAQLSAAPESWRFEADLEASDGEGFSLTRRWDASIPKA